MVSGAPQGLLRRYAEWIGLTGRRWPVGLVERLPEVGEDGRTAVPGLYVAGDLSGVPLLKLASEGGARVARAVAADPGLERERRASAAGVVDLVIVGGGVAGGAAGLEARRLGLSFRILEAHQPFATLAAFPQRKPIYTYPKALETTSPLRFSAEVREALLTEVRAQTADLPVEITRAVEVRRRGALLGVVTEGGVEVLGRRVLVAIGRSGDHRRLGVPGEALDHVSARLHDPAAFSGQDVVVVGGGDSAAEAAVALCEAGARVTVIHRQGRLDRPKPDNVARLTGLAARGALTLRLGAVVEAIEPHRVRLRDARGEAWVAGDAVFTLIGREAPLPFFRRSGVPIRGEISPRGWALCALFVVFCFALYNWKSGGSLATWAADARLFPTQLTARVNDVEPLPSGGFGRRQPWAYLDPVPDHFQRAADAARARLTAGDLSQTWDEAGHLARQVEAARPVVPLPPGQAPPRDGADRTSLVGTLLVSATSPAFWYTLAYVGLVGAFGLKRIRARRTPYVTRQTWTLMAIQALPLFVLPEIVLPLLGYHGLLPGPLADALFPPVDYGHGREYWRAYGLILAWPLNVYNWQTEEPLWAWLAIGGVQTFVLIPALVWRYGKGAYCGWICSCGALAETLGDTHRQKMPHGPAWSRLNVIGQVLLGVAVVLFLLRILSWALPDLWWLRHGLGVAKDGSGATGAWAWVFGWLNWKWTVDVGLAGVLGYGLYFWASGRTWCRFACPLAALMHLYAAASRFRILADKKKCISCNVCTSVCHQGIDVMAFANQGKAMADPQCVRCSACVSACPTGTLVFGRVDGEGRPVALDGLGASAVHTREGRPALGDVGDDRGHVG